MATWRKMLQDVFTETGDNFSDLIANTLTDDELDVEFDDSYGTENGKPFAAYSADWVYFPACYDGAEWVAYVPHNPTGKPIKHIGG